MKTAPDRPQDVPLEERVEQLKPRPGCVLLGIPVLAVVATFIAYAWLFWNGWVGRPASGPEVELAFEGCGEASDIVLDRLEDMGLGRPGVTRSATGFRLTTQLPSAESTAAELGAVLATPGRFEMRDGAEVLATHQDIAYAGVRLDLTMSPSTLVMLQDAGRDRVYARMGEKPDAKTHMYVDGVEVWAFGNRKPSMNGEFEIPPDAEDDKARMKLAAARGIVLNHGPLPCEVRVVD